MRTILITAFLALLSVTVSLAQPSWLYSRAIGFPAPDLDRVRPYGVTVDASGTIWVVSSGTIDTAAHNCLWKAGPNDTVFTKVKDYGSYYDNSFPYDDHIIGTIQGITSVGTDVYISGNQPYPLTVPNTLAFIYLLKGGDPANTIKAGWGLQYGSGYGTYISAIQLTKDTIAFVGCPYDPNHVGGSFRAYNYRMSDLETYDPDGALNTRTFTQYIPPPYYNPEAGGPMDANAFDQIRDVALIPGMNYGLTTADTAAANRNSYFYTSRNSTPTNPTSGGIAVWKGGSEIQPSKYTSKRVSDIGGLLSFGPFAYYGITADSAGNLYVCGTDSLRKWVKVFNVQGTFATEIADFPSATTMQPGEQDPKGAPFVAPVDIVLTTDQKTAYVADVYGRKVFVFKFGTSLGVNEKPSQVAQRFTLNQNYPNPFNPTTTISYELPTAARVTLRVYNVLGTEVAMLVNGSQSAGKHVATFDAMSLPAGLYFYTLESGATHLTKKMVILK